MTANFISYLVAYNAYRNGEIGVIPAQGGHPWARR